MTVEPALIFVIGAAVGPVLFRHRTAIRDRVYDWTHEAPEDPDDTAFVDMLKLWVDEDKKAARFAATLGETDHA